MKLVSLILCGVVLHAGLARAAETPKTLLEIAGVRQDAARLSDAVLIVIDAQREYVDGKLPLAGIGPSIQAAANLLQRARNAGTPIIHVVHRGKGALFDPASASFAVVAQLQPATGEMVIEKLLPNAFAGTDLAAAIARTGRKNLIIVGYMTHMCVSATARAALDLGFRSTIVAEATATRDLPDGSGGVIPAATVKSASLAALSDRFAVVVRRAQDIVD